MAITLETNTPAYLSSVWRDATNPNEFVDELILAQEDIVITKGADGGNVSSSVTTTAIAPTAVDNGNNVFSVPLTAEDLNFVGRAFVLVHPAGSFPRSFDIEVVAKSEPPEPIDTEFPGIPMALLVEITGVNSRVISNKFNIAGVRRSRRGEKNRLFGFDECKKIANAMNTGDNRTRSGATKLLKHLENHVDITR